jgi:hypothetical protein
MSKYIQKYINAVTYYTPYGGETETVFCVRFENGLYVVQNKFLHEYKITESAIKEILPSPKPDIKYPVGSIVEYIIDFHQLAGETLSFGKIIGYKIFYNDVEYTIQNLNGAPEKLYSKSYIKRIATKKVPKYVVNQRVQVITQYACHPMADNTVKIGMIISIFADYNQVKYSIRFDSGEEKEVNESDVSPYVPAPKVVQQTSGREWLFAEEQRLLQELQNVRQRLSKIDF